ncbi:MAG TPA: MerR family transcriptional regulator [Acidimicrobiales bacterium]|nr:MerR family transcriptional regulator [Acidimicrobiales bacterium]
MSSRSFSGGEVARLIGVNYGHVDRWTRLGLVEPSIAPGTGFGCTRGYSFADLVACGVMRELRIGLGIEPHNCREALEFLRGVNLSRLARDQRLLIRADGCSLSKASDDATGLSGIVIDLPGLVEELERATAPSGEQEQELPLAV